MSVRQYYSSITPKRQVSIKWKENRDKYKEGSDFHEFPLHLSSNKIHRVILTSKSSLLRYLSNNRKRNSASRIYSMSGNLVIVKPSSPRIREVFPLFNPGGLWSLGGNTESQLTWKRPSKVIFETGRDWVISPETGPVFVSSSHPEVFSSLPHELEKLIS